MEKKDPISLANLIVRGNYINISKTKPFCETSGIYRFTNEDITSYFQHLLNKEKILTVIGSGSQILNSILAGSTKIDCFDISIFPQYYLFLQICSVMSLSKEEYLRYYFSDDKEELFNDIYYDKISTKLTGIYKEFWDSLYNFNESVDIYNSLLFRQDVCIKDEEIRNNPYLQEDNYERLKHILQTRSIKINPFITDVTKTRFEEEYDLVNLSNILAYHFKDINEYINYLKTHFNLSSNGEIINYIFKMCPEFMDIANSLLKPNGYVEEINGKKLLVFKK